MYDRLVAFAARLAPLSIAVSDGTHHIDFRTLADSIVRVSVAIEAAGLRRERALAAVAIGDTYRHLLVLLGCARLGIATMSVGASQAPSAIALTSATALIADDAALAPDLLADADWLGGLFASPAASLPRIAIDPDALGRVQLSSGSTGEPKAIGLSWAQFERRIDHVWNRPGTERLLSLIGPESGALPLFVVAWARCGCVLIGPPSPAGLAAALPHLAPTGLVASSIQLGALLDALPPELPPLPNLRVAVTGGRASRALRERAAARLGGIVTVAYASSEAGNSTLGIAGTLPDDAAVGWPTPWTEIEIVDGADRPLPAGATGRIRIRGADVADGYLSGPSPQFRDGWFYPGDLGSIDASGMVRVEGREDELMNLGGAKFLPEAIETPVRALPEVADAAAFAIDATPWIAVVRRSAVAEETIAAVLRLPELPPVRIAWVDAVPRSAMGKVQREHLRDAVRARLAGSSA